MCMQVPYVVKGADDGEVVLACANADEGQLYPEEVSGQVLAHLLAHAEQSTGTTISKAVISVSAHCHSVLGVQNLRVMCLCEASSLQRPSLQQTTVQRPACCMHWCYMRTAQSELQRACLRRALHLQL